MNGRDRSVEQDVHGDESMTSLRVSAWEATLIIEPEIYHVQPLFEAILPPLLPLQPKQ